MDQAIENLKTLEKQIAETREALWREKSVATADTISRSKVLSDTDRIRLMLGFLSQGHLARFAMDCMSGERGAHIHEDYYPGDFSTEPRDVENIAWMAAWAVDTARHDGGWDTRERRAAAEVSWQVRQIRRYIVRQYEKAFIPIPVDSVVDDYVDSRPPDSYAKEVCYELKVLGEMDDDYEVFTLVHGYIDLVDLHFTGDSSPKETAKAVAVACGWRLPE